MKYLSKIMSTIYDKDSYRKFIRKLDMLDPQKRYYVTVKEIQQSRSLAQNDLYQVWTKEVAESTGYSHESIKLFFRHQFLGYEETEVNGIVAKELVSTTKITTKRFSEFLKEVQEFAKENMGVDLRFPDGLEGLCIY